MEANLYGSAVRRPAVAVLFLHSRPLAALNRAVSGVARLLSKDESNNKLKTTGPEAMWLKSNEWTPNNTRLPVLVYRDAIDIDTSDPVARCEALFADNGWLALLRNEIHLFHHYHSTTHEVLGIVEGWARLVLGGPNGPRIIVRAGDALMLPIGTGRCQLGASADFRLIGAYPHGQSPDVCRSAPTPDMLARMARQPVPACDPVFGEGGPMTDYWTLN